MTPKSSGLPPRSYRHHHHQEGSLSLQLLPRSTPIGAQSPSRSPHHRSPSRSRFPKFEESSVDEKSRSDGVVARTSPVTAVASTYRAVPPEPLSSPHQSRPSSAASLRHLTSHQSSASQDYPLSPIPNTPTPHFALPLPSLHSGYLHPPRKIRLWSIVKPWLPVLAYISTSLGFLIAIAFWKTQVFQGLDDLSSWLKADKTFGHGVLFFLIFLTTFPPLPLYSTLIVLSGYTYGAWAGAVLSYWAALTGAFVVFVLSRYLFRRLITRWLSNATSVKRVVRAIEKRPQLLFLIRLAPYPYNVMNCLLGASPTLTLRTYLVCTALSLFKVIIHTALGSSIHSFARYHVQPKTSHDTAPDAEDGPSPSDGGTDTEEENPIGFYFKIAAMILALGVFVYIAVVARKAVNDELDDDEDVPSHTDEEAVSFLSPSGIGRHSEDERDPYVNARTGEPMSETPFYVPITPSSAVAAAIPHARPSPPPGVSRIGGDGGRNGATRDVRRHPREEGSALH
ncbi:hypothetical protein F5148DRAFT_579763 [Russula earlei]|uniref:Uncharacterized protein n=1 Tax=Russula earlei TaxID=71964 RepID=A0ACC0UFC4_9AGAM|nr:hypothetical protein F5148DRAFT_579763 [Russula earlei]